MLRKVIQIFIGHAIFTFGIALIVIANLGVGAWDTVYLGLQSHLGGTYGTYSFIIQTIIIFVNALILWERPNLRALILVVLTAVLIDFWLEIVLAGVTLTSMTIQISVFILGAVLLAFGIAFYIQSNLISSPFDGLMIATSKRLKLSLGTSRLLNDITAIAVGVLLLGGPFGITTFILLFLGYLIQFFYKLLDNHYPITEKKYV